MTPVAAVTVAVVVVAVLVAVAVAVAVDAAAVALDFVTAVVAVVEEGFDLLLLSLLLLEADRPV